jgi:hypothetical protein
MAKQLTTASVATGLTIEAGHVTQSAVAFTGGEAYDITISGSLTVTGSTDINGTLSIPGFSDVSASLASSGGSGFPFTGSAIISGSLIVTGSTGLLNPDQTITLRNTSGSTFRTLGDDAPGVFLDVNKTDTGLGRTSLMLGNINPDVGGTIFPVEGMAIEYITGSDGASGSVSFFVGQRDFTNIGGQTQNLISLDYEPGPIASIGDPEITLQIGQSSNNSYNEAIFGRVIKSSGETAQLTIGETDSSNAQQINIVNNIVGTSGSYEIFTTNKSPNTTAFRQGMISASGETGLSYFGLNYNQYTSTTSSLDLKIGDQGFTNQGPRFEYTYAKDSNNFNDQSTLIKLGHDTSYGGTININEYRNNATASIAGFFTGSEGYSNQQAGAVPFVLFNDKAGVRNSTSPAFVIEQTFPATGSTPNPTFRIDHNGNIPVVGNITSSGNISASGDLLAHDILLVGTVSDSPNIQLMRAGVTGANLKMGGGVDQNGILELKNINGGQDILLQGQGISYFSQSLKIGAPYVYPENNPATLTVDGNISASGAFNTLSHITASGNISASGDYFGDAFRAHGDDANSGFVLTSLSSKPSIFAFDDKIQICTTIATTIPTRLNSDNVEILGHVSGSGSACFQAGKPIITHTSSPISSSLANAGKYHIVHGTLTASIVLDGTAPIGAEYEFFQSSSAGQFLFESASGTTVISKNGSMRLAQQGSSAVLKKVGTSTFHLMGDLT